MEQALARKAEIDRELGRLRKEARVTRRRDARKCTVPTVMWQVVTAIFVLTHPAVEPACWYLEQRWRHWDSQKENVRSCLQAWYAGLLATSTVASVLQPSTSAARDALQKATTFVQELQLHDWVDNANRAQGIAPMSSVLIDQATGQLPSSRTKPLLYVGMRKKYKLQWLRRWRRRWRVGLGPLQPRDTLPPAECQRNVFFPEKHILSLGPDSPFFCTWTNQCHQKGVHIMAPFWGAFT